MHFIACFLIYNLASCLMYVQILLPDPHSRLLPRLYHVHSADPYFSFGPLNLILACSLSPSWLPNPYSNLLPEVVRHVVR
jgi:hypothetical protein